MSKSVRVCVVRVHRGYGTPSHLPLLYHNDRVRDHDDGGGGGGGDQGCLNPFQFLNFCKSHCYCLLAY